MKMDSQLYSGNVERVKAVVQRLKAVAIREKVGGWCMVVTATLLSWSFMHFQINVYLLMTEYWSLIILGSIFYLAYWAIDVLKSRVDRLLLLMSGLYLTSLMFYLAIVPVTMTVLKLSAASMLYWLLGFTIIRSSLHMQRFLNFKFALGISLIFLNTVPIFHWLGLLQLDFRYVPRVGGELGLGHLDPISFGVFGATESAINEFHYIATARLQGWSSEPLHWGYFVLLSSCMTLLLMSLSKNINKIRILGAVLLYILVYSYFLHSSTVNLSLVGILIALVAYRMLHRRIRSDSGKAFLLLVLTVIGPGFFIPFTLATIPGIELLFFEEEVLGEGSNWQNKIEWLFVDNLYGRFLPQISSNLTASHNFFLTYYLNIGYALTLPLLFFFYYLFLFTVKSDSAYLCAATIVFVIAHTITIDAAFMSPSFVLWFLLIYYAGRKLLAEKRERLRLNGSNSINGFV